LSLKETAAKVTGRATFPLTDDQWRERIAASQKKLDKLKAGIVGSVMGNVSNPQRAIVLTALGLSEPPEAKTFEFTLPATLDRTYSVTGTTEAEAATALLAKIGLDGAKHLGRSDRTVLNLRDGNVQRDVTALNLIVQADAAKAADTATVDGAEVSLVEQYATLEAEYEALKVAAREQAIWLQNEARLCLSGINDELRKLKLDPLPAKKYFYVEAPIAAVVRYEVQAYDEAGAIEAAKLLSADNQRQGRVYAGQVKNLQPSTGDLIVVA